MSDKAELNEKQVMLIMTNLLIIKMIFAFPKFLFARSGNAAWIQALYLTAAAWLLFEASVAFYRKTGRRSVIQLAESVGKMPLKIIVSLITVAVFVSSAGVTMRMFAESVKLILLPRTEIEYIMLLFGAAVAVGSLCGFSALSVINALFMPFCLFFLGLLGVCLIKYFDVNNLMPLWGLGRKSIFLHGLKELYCFADIFALNLLLPYCSDIETAKKGGRRAIFTAGAVITLLCAVYGMIYPYPYSADFLLSAYQLTRMVRAGEYFQRFEALFEFVWAITQLLYSSIYISLICRVIADGFKLKYHAPLVPCITLIVAVIALEAPSVPVFMQMTEKVKQLTMPYAYLLPIIIPAAYIIVRRRKNAA